jgi:hypothetical protein
MPNDLVIITWLWGEKHYTEKDVLALRDGLAKRLMLPYRFVCITDFKRDLGDIEQIVMPNIQLVPNADQLTEKLGVACLRRIRLFDSAFTAQFKDATIVNVDLDVELRGNLDPLFEWLRSSDSFKIMRGVTPQNEYNGSIFALRQGSHSRLWHSLNYTDYKAAIEKYVGSDQAWIRYCLFPEEVEIIEEHHGVYQARILMHLRRMVRNANIVFFAGKVKRRDKPAHRMLFRQLDHNIRHTPETQNAP